MSIELYNEEAFRYEEQTQSLLNTRYEVIGDITEFVPEMLWDDSIEYSEDPFAPSSSLSPEQWDAYEHDVLWNDYEFMKPDEYSDHGIPTSTVHVIFDKLKDEFYFPAKGLKGLAKTRLAIKLNQLAKTLSLANPVHAQRIANTAQFLDDNLIVYDYC